MLSELDPTQLPRNCRLVVLPEETTETTSDMFADLPEVLTAQQVAKALCICDKQVRELALQGKLVGFRVGKCHRFTKKAVLDFVKGGGTDAQGKEL